jgi:hypothetical protein
MKLRTTRVIQALAVSIAAGALPLTAVATSATGSTTAGTTAGTTAYCGITWGSLAKSSAPMVRGPLTGVRAGRHACFDRLVIDVTGHAPGFSVQYVNAVYTEGQGALVPLRGGARLRVVTKAPAYTSTGAPSFTPANRSEVVNVAGYPTFRQVAWAGSFEGQTTLGLGVRARLPFRVFTIQDATTSRLVIDVANHW